MKGKTCECQVSPHSILLIKPIPIKPVLRMCEFVPQCTHSPAVEGEGGGLNQISPSRIQERVGYEFVSCCTLSSEFEHLMVYRDWKEFSTL